MARKGSESQDLRDRWMDRDTGLYGGDPAKPDRDTRERLTDTTSRNEASPDTDANGLGGVLGTSTGEEDRDPVPGGWEGTDDATSTAPSDLTPVSALDEGEPDPDEVNGRAYGGGIGEGDGGIVDIKGSPVEESRDWEHDPIVAEK